MELAAPPPFCILPGGLCFLPRAPLLTPRRLCEALCCPGLGAGPVPLQAHPQIHFPPACRQVNMVIGILVFNKPVQGRITDKKLKERQVDWAAHHDFLSQDDLEPPPPTKHRSGMEGTESLTEQGLHRFSEAVKPTAQDPRPTGWRAVRPPSPRPLWSAGPELAQRPCLQCLPAREGMARRDAPSAWGASPKRAAPGQVHGAWVAAVRAVCSI